MNTTGNRTATEQATEGQPTTTTASATATTEHPAGTRNKPLRSEERTSAIRSAPQTARPVGVEGIDALRALNYERYLRTRWWFHRRNAALKLARYQCQRCAANRTLQVHHLRYDHLGDEPDADLQVLCRGCHLGHHVVEATPHRSVYLALISAALEEEQFTSLSDLTEDVKRRCATLKLPYEQGEVQRVLARLNGERLNLADQPVTARRRELLHEGVGYAPMTKAEAAGWMTRLGAKAKTMPAVPRMTRRQADAVVALRQLSALIVDQVRVCDEAEEAEPTR